MSSIDWDKPIQTRGGFDVTIYTRKGLHATLCVVGEIHCESAILTQWHWDGTHERDGQPSPSDLVNVAQQHTMRLNAYRRTNYSQVFVCAEDDYSEAGKILIACFEHTFTEGDGLDEH